MTSEQERDEAARRRPEHADPTGTGVLETVRTPLSVGLALWLLMIVLGIAGGAILVWSNRADPAGTGSLHQNQFAEGAGAHSAASGMKPFQPSPQTSLIAHPDRLRRGALAAPA